MFDQYTNILKYCVKMSILVKDYIWKQSDEYIFIEVPLKGIHCSKVDIFSFKSFIKLSYNPFIFEVFLLHNIKYNEAICTFNNNTAFLQLHKEEINHWECLEMPYNKKEKNMKRKEISQEFQLENNDINKNKQKRASEFKRFLIEEAIKINENEVKKVNIINENIKNQTNLEINNWKIESLEINEKVIKNSKGVDKSEKNTNILDKRKENNVSQIERKKSVTKSEFYKKIINDINTRILPQPREGGTISLQFTERSFPTPCRESLAKEEEIWLKKINEAKRASGFIPEDLRPEECNPQWCKNKGDYFLKIKNYVGAINAYTHGIKLSSQLPSLYANRALVHYILGNFHKCIEDCSSALNLLVPHCELNLKSRVKCIVRRAAALTRIGMLSKAIDEMSYAVKLQPNNEKLKEDICSMEKAWEQNPDSE